MSIELRLPSTTVQPETGMAMTSEVVAETSREFAELERLSPEEQQQVDAFVAQIDLHDSTIVTCYGAEVQRKLDKYTDGTLESVSGRDVGAIGDLLAEMSTSIKDFDDKTNSKILALFINAKKRAEVLRVKYDDVVSTLKRIKEELLGQQKVLLVDIKTLDQMYDQNLEYYKELTMYILAGKKKLTVARSVELEDLRRKAEISKLQEDAFAYSDFRDRCDNFEKQIYDLELTRAVCQQSAPQIRLVQKTDEELARKIQSTVNNTIPIWKQKIAIALAVQHNAEAAEMQRGITDLTNQMLTESARQLHTSTVAAAKEAERGIIDIEAVKTSNAELIATINDVITVQEEGRKMRAAAEIELQQAEEGLKQALLGANRQNR